MIYPIISKKNIQTTKCLLLKQTIIGRLLNYGTIVISGRGTSKVILNDIDRVIETRKLIKNS